MPVDFTENMKQRFAACYRWLSPPWPLSWHIAALVGSIALPALFLGAFLLNQQHQAELEIVTRDAVARVEAISHSTDAAIMGIVSTLRGIGANPALASGDVESFVKQSQASFGDAGIAVTLWNEALTAIKSTQDSGLVLRLAGEEAELARNALASGNPKFSNFSTAPGSGLPVVHVWVPIKVFAQPKFLLNAMIPATSFNKTLLQSQLPLGWAAGVSDRHDHIIGRTEGYEQFVGRLISEETRRKSIAPSGIIRTTDLLGRPTLQAYVHSQLTGWRLATWAPRSLIEARALENWNLFMGMGGLLAAFAAMSAWLWASRMTASVSELAESARLLESDRLLDEVKTPVLEVNILRDTISMAAAELIRRKEALAENEERLRLALDSGGMGVWEWDPETDVAFFDAAQYRLTGFEPDAMPATGAMFIAQIHPDDTQRVTAALKKAAESGEPYNEEFRFFHPDGSMLWLAGRGRAMPESGSGRKRFVGVNFDITEEREHAARTRALLREVSHRSKNLLAVILAIGRLTARDAPTVKAYERALTLRVGALAASQDLIVASDWQGVDMKALVLGQLNALINDKIARARVSGPEITLNPTAAQNLGMAIAELGLNAVDHGALSNDAGTVTISWDVTVPGQLSLSWTEQGGPAVTPAQKRGYGLAVVERLVVQSLKAKAHIQFAVEGVRWSLSAPLDTMVSRESDVG